jgi:hypothetical protein
MRKKKDSYDDGEYFTVEQLITMSLIKFQILKDSGKWYSILPEHERIVTLTSEVIHLKYHNLKLANTDKPTKSNNSGDKPKQFGKGKNPIKKGDDKEK